MGADEYDGNQLGAGVEGNSAWVTSQCGQDLIEIPGRLEAASRQMLLPLHKLSKSAGLCFRTNRPRESGLDLL
jgi:hypothetical protein